MKETMIRYDIRNILVGDEEETRILDDVAGRLKAWKDEGMTMGDLSRAVDYLVWLYDGIDCWDDLLKILMRYVTSQERIEISTGEWLDKYEKQVFGE